MNKQVPCGDDKLCEQCRHFHRHYVRVGGSRYIPILSGHCSHPRLKDRDADTPACARFSPRPPQKTDHSHHRLSSGQ